MAKRETTMQDHAAAVQAGEFNPPAHNAISADDFSFNHAIAHVAEPVRQVTLPVLKFEAGQRIVFKAISEIHPGKEMSEGRAGKTKMEPADLLKVQSAGGAQRVLIVSAVLKSELMENYPDHGYVGRWFACQKFAPAGEKKYATFHIIELADPTAKMAAALAAD